MEKYYEVQCVSYQGDKKIVNFFSSSFSQKCFSINFSPLLEIQAKGHSFRGNPIVIIGFSPQSVNIKFESLNFFQRRKEFMGGNSSLLGI